MIPATPEPKSRKMARNRDFARILNLAIMYENETNLMGSG
jgi:hypothetical protein